MTAFLRLLMASFFVLPTLASAQTYPSRSETAVTDDAEVIAPVAEAELAERLTAIGQANNAEVVIVTLPSMAFYTAGEDIDVYAQGLMANWDLGDTVGDRGILVLVFAEDRELRIQTGIGFGPEAEATAVAIVADTLVPPLREDNYEQGFANTVGAIEQRLLIVGEATPAPQAEPEVTPTATETAPVAVAADGAATEGEEGGSNILIWIGGGIAALVALVVGANRRAAAKLAATPCPNCSKTGLTRERTTLQEATEYREGHGEVRTSCPHCGNVETEPFTIRQREADKPEKSDKAGARDPVVHGTTKGGPGPKGKGGATPTDKGGGGASGEF